MRNAVLLVLAAGVAANAARADAPERSVRPMVRPVSTISPGENSAFRSWLRDFEGRARSDGIPQPLLERAFAGIGYNGDVIKRDRSQNEFTKTVWVYLDSAASEARIAAGKAAMGHTQFMPSSWRDHAVDHTGDGKRDIWGDDPADALASAANYLKANGWQSGVPWGVEVRLPAGFNHMLARRDLEKMPSEWARLGVRDMTGAPVPDHGPASILLPGGARGAAFLIFRNFEVIESYNTADAYVIGVGHLADRLAGGPPIRASWPRGDRALTLPERLELQRLLRARGFDPQKLDGKIGPLTINAVRAYQKDRGLIADGYPSPGFLARLRRTP